VAIEKDKIMRLAAALSSGSRAYGLALALGLLGVTGLGNAQAHAQAANAPATVWDYRQGVNPATNVPLASPYDFEDRYRDGNGFPLPGDAQIR
jgi:hypothetical protein